ncbi:MAG: DUF3102 domain-containing protein [Methylobacter sp.]|uniref:DUF3102 domain-containing protein n=1 Tax=Methylobacter sp. TaxID=2051955 RepID=UPI00273063B0|nr:DUF3102 domain-containing protein [Methylobacter sp.]MDP1664994.1 DUF3102 domain-containing protein [Methylobacter sp.]
MSQITAAELKAIAAEINEREAQIISMVRQSLNLAALIGQSLNRIKASLPLGDFMPWLAENCQVKQAQCNRYMRLATNCPEYLISSNCPTGLALNTALELITAPDDVRELVLEAVEAGEVVPQKIIRELRGKRPYPYPGQTAAKPDLKAVQPININTPPRTETWLLVPHVCRHCCGRLLKRNISPTVTEVICAKCETRERGPVDSLCWCGKETGTYGRIFECIQNPNRRPELPNAIMVREKSAYVKAPEIRPSRYAGIAGASDL